LLFAAAVRRATRFICCAVVGAAAIACAPPPDLGGEAPGGVDEARLDREAPGGACGHPSSGDAGYGTAVGDRLANNGELALASCTGERVELADFFCPRDDGSYNRGVFINLGAGWCAPCQEETLELAPLYDEYHGRGIEFVQVLFQDWNAQAPTQQFCSDWRDGNWVATDGADVEADLRLKFPIVMDQHFDWTSGYLADPASATPMSLLVDANGNIRWKLEGQKPDLDVLRSQFELVIKEPYAPPT
jgi:thiol-disulfide isomerase/thioredoxin